MVLTFGRNDLSRAVVKIGSERAPAKSAGGALLRQFAQPASQQARARDEASGHRAGTRGAADAPRDGRSGDEKGCGDEE